MGIRRVTFIGTVLLLIMMLLFLVVTLYSTTSLTSQIKMLTEHPFTVNGDISEVKTNLALMRIRTDRMQVYNQPEDIKIVRAALLERYEDMDGLIDEIDSLYLGPEEDVDRLRDTYAQIQEVHRDFLEFSALPTSETEAIVEYEEENLYPLYDTFEEEADRILAYVRKTQQNIFQSAEDMSRFVLQWSVIISILTATGLISFQRIIQAINLRLFQKNKQFELLSDTIDETFLIFEKGKRKCEFVSGNAERVLGISVEELTEDNTLLYQYMQQKDILEIHQKLYAESRQSWESMIEYEHSQSLSSHWLQMQFYLIENGGGTKCIMTFTDRTEERRTNQALQDALESAQKANNAKKDFLSRMSHEIRTPMNAIIGMTTIAAASMTDKRKVESCLEKISYSSKHLLMLINDVLDMSRIENNRININREPFELYQFVNSFVSVVYPQTREKGLDFSENTKGFSEHTTYLGDTLRLNQILLNLVSNAIKFTPSGGKVHMEVILLPVRNNTSWIRFVVSDTGIGMDEQELERLYKPFEQANASIAGKYGGSGLGMSITQNLVSLMGGYIGVKSKRGEGTTFTVELPFEQSDVDIMPMEERALENLHVLIVDDERDICEHTALLLGKMRIRAEWVLSGAEAVEQVTMAWESGNGFDVCFIDWQMPEMDGIETVRRIRKKVGGDTPIIIISAYDWSEIEQEAREAGVNAFIAKPLFQSSIYNALVSATNGGYGRPDLQEIGKERLLKGMHLLVAEDNPLNMEIIVELLEINGATVESAVNGEVVMQKFLRSPRGSFDAILMDVQMPVMDGQEATRQIRASGHEDAVDIPIIAITANAFEEDVASVLAAGMNAHIGKPYDIHKLCALLIKLRS